MNNMKAFFLAGAFSLASAAAFFAQTPPGELSPSPSIAISPTAAPVASTPSTSTPAAALTPRSSPVTAATASASIPNRFADEIKRKASKRGQHKNGFHIEINDDEDGLGAAKNSHDGGDIPSEVLPIVAISVLAVFGFPVAIVAVIMFSGWAKARSLHKTVRMLVEKGQPVPPELLASPAGTPLRPWYDLRRGIILLAVGMGVIFFFASVGGWDSGVWALGLIPAIMGAGYILAWRLAQRQGNGFKM